MKNDIELLLLSWEESNKKKFSTPYIFQINKDGQDLVYFGAEHSNDPNNEQFRLMEKLWNEILHKHSRENIISIFEGSGVFKINLSKEESILRFGESGFIAYLGNKSGVQVFGFEPNRGDIMKELIEKYDKENCFYQHIAQLILQWNRYLRKPDFENYINRFIKRDEKETGWGNFDFSLSNIKVIHEKLFNTTFDENDKDFFSKIVDPSKNIGIINEITRRVSLIRNINIVQGISGEWKKGNSIFVVYGSGHAVIQEPALKELLK